MSVKVGEQISLSVDVTEGVLQGEVLSPIIFALFLADLSDFLEYRGIVGVNISCNYDISLLAYADDLVFIATSPAGLKKLLKALHEYCTLNHLTLNPRKSKIIIFKKGGPKMDTHFYYGNTEIEVVNDYTYLGISFCSSGLFEKSANIVVAKASLASASVISLLGSTKYVISWDKINLLFTSLVSSIISHASPVWALKYLSMLEKIQCQFFKRVLWLPKCTPNYAVRLEVGRPHLSVHILKLTLNWLTKLAKMPQTRYPYMCLLCLCTYDTKNSNIVKYNWVSMVKQVFFSPINELELWDDLNNFLMPEVVERVLDKFSAYTYMLDMESVPISSSLLFYPSLNINNECRSYFYFKISFEIKRIYSQCRLLNIYSKRIITKKGVYKFHDMGDCNYCNRDNNDLLHKNSLSRKPRNASTPCQLNIDRRHRKPNYEENRIQLPTRCNHQKYASVWSPSSS